MHGQSSSEPEIFILLIEHPVTNFYSWKAIFDSDPANRKEAGVKNYTISQLIDNPNYVQINLRFDDLSNAEGFLNSMKRLWSNVDGKLIHGPKGSIYRLIESNDYAK